MPGPLSVTRSSTQRLCDRCPGRLRVPRTTLPSPVHGLGGVAHQVHEDLPQLLGVDADPRKILGQIELERDLVVAVGRQDLHRAAHHAVHVDRGRVALGRTRVVEHRSHDPIEPIDLFQNDAEKLARRGVELRRPGARLGQKLGRAFDGSERVFHLVRQPGRHLPDGGETIALLHPLVDERVLDDHAGLRGQALEQATPLRASTRRAPDRRR